MIIFLVGKSTFLHGLCGLNKKYKFRNKTNELAFRQEILFSSQVPLPITKIET